MTDPIPPNTDETIPCCHADCGGKPAAFYIEEDRTDICAGYDACTYACEEHLGDLIGTTVGEGYDPEVTVTHWHLFSVNNGH